MLLDTSIYQFGYPSYTYQEHGDDQCLGNHTAINANLINGDADKGITCSRKDSVSMDGVWTYENGSIIDCSNNNAPVRCVEQSGSVILYAQFDDQSNDPFPDGTYTCCIEGLCISIRLYQEDTFNDISFTDGKYGSLTRTIIIILALY